MKRVATLKDQYSADAFIGKRFIVNAKAVLVRNPSQVPPQIIRTVEKGQSLPVVQSYVGGNKNIPDVWLQFADKDSPSGFSYWKLNPSVIGKAQMKTQGVKSEEQKYEEQKKEEDKENDKFEYYLKLIGKPLLFIAGAALLVKVATSEKK